MYAEITTADVTTNKVFVKNFLKRKRNSMLQNIPMGKHAKGCYLTDCSLFLPPINQSLPSLVSEMLSVEMVGVRSDSIV